MDIKRISSDLSVSAQIYPEQMKAIAAAGFRTIVNNRPDKEAEDQPLSADLATEAARHGMVLFDQPVINGLLAAEDGERFGDRLKSATGPVLAFCRTGNRSTTLWAMSEARFVEIDVILNIAESIGYDLSVYQEEFDEIASQA